MAMNSGYIEPYKTYKGYIISQGITMPSYDIYEYEVFENFGQFEKHNPVHTAKSDREAERWVDSQVKPRVKPPYWSEGRRIAEQLGNGVTYNGPQMSNGEFQFHLFTDSAVTGTTFAGKDFEEAKQRFIKVREEFGAEQPADAEDIKKAIEAMPFMPEKGPPLPEYVTAELYPSPTWDTMKAPVSDYGKVVVDETARLLMEFVLGGHFERRTKFEETGWSSDGIIYTGELLHTATGVVYLTEIYVSFAWRDPTKDVTRTITLFEEKPDGPEDIWDGDLSCEGGRVAGQALQEEL